ncbi:Ribosome biogenesis protein WDR12-like [Citrus sinensis]|uniref:Ribosome biogenesis protein WDR12-like n=1 Tax=Citrus sinensis TaxID=2711 RepID=A0ACB8K5C4_CITSI|nr:Ribosome biogenesis protein WDR12-like [Citrus sinensis]
MDMNIETPEDQNEENSRRVQVRFKTKLKPPQKVPSNSIAIPSNLTRFGLSSVVNNLLQAVNPEWKSEPFDFLINGELVRMSLEQFLLAKGISAEKVLEIEYIKAVAPQKEEEPSLHDDWVSAVDGSNPGVWKAGGVCTHILEGHCGAVSSVNIIKSDVCFAACAGLKYVTVATASKDQTLRLWKVCSGSWDCTISLWRTNDSDAAGNQVSIKKRKGNNQVEEPQLEGEAISTLVGHTQCVSSVVWPQQETIYSASWDHSVRTWDVEMGKDLSDIFCGKALNCIDIGGEGSALIAAGGSDPILRIWDPRKPGTSAPVFQFSSHNSWISACKWHNKSWFHLISASYDGKVMLWDLRTAWPLSVIDSHKDKVLCADWWRGDSVISGGVDSKLCVSSGVSIQ